MGQEVEKLERFAEFLINRNINKKEHYREAANTFLEYEQDDRMLAFLATAYTTFGHTFDIVDFEKANSGEYCFLFSDRVHYALIRQTAEDLIEETCDNCANELFGDENACHKCYIGFKTQPTYKNSWTPIPEDIDDYD